MANCIVNIISGKAFIQFDQVVENGVVLVFNNIKNLIKYQEIKNSNSTKFILPDTEGRISLHIYFGQNEIVKKVNVASNKKNTVKKL